MMDFISTYIGYLLSYTEHEIRILKIMLSSNFQPKIWSNILNLILKYLTIFPQLSIKFVVCM